MANSFLYLIHVNSKLNRLVPYFLETMAKGAGNLVKLANTKILKIFPTLLKPCGKYVLFSYRIDNFISYITYKIVILQNARFVIEQFKPHNIICLHKLKL